MKIKLEENIGVRGSEFLAERAHDVSPVRDQKLSSRLYSPRFGFGGRSRAWRFDLKLEHAATSRFESGGR